jgi:hypothetical protein
MDDVVSDNAGPFCGYGKGGLDDKYNGNDLGLQ